MTGDVEIVVQADGGVFLESGGSWRGLVVRFRAVGGRRWTKFIVVGQDGQSLRDLLSAALTVVAHSTEASASRGILDAPAGQLELGATA